MEILLSIVLFIFGILQIILFFKLWGMTDDIRAIKDKYLNPQAQEIPETYVDPKNESPILDGVSRSGFKNGDLVALRTSGKQMRIKEFNAEKNVFECYTQNYSCYEGSFKASELTIFGR